mgnify:CR=1 FL=1|jgi:hypothetical protein
MSVHTENVPVPGASDDEGAPKSFDDNTSLELNQGDSKSSLRG